MAGHSYGNYLLNFSQKFKEFFKFLEKISFSNTSVEKFAILFYLLRKHTQKLCLVLSQPLVLTHTNILGFHCAVYTPLLILLILLIFR